MRSCSYLIMSISNARLSDKELKTAKMVVAEEYPSDGDTATVKLRINTFDNQSSIPDQPNVFGSRADQLKSTTEFIKRALAGWDIQIYNNIVIRNDPEPNNFYLKILYIDRYIPQLDETTKCFHIFSIVIPDHCRRMGFAASIIDLVESFATKKCKSVIIGPVMDDGMGKLINKRGKYTRRSFFDSIFIVQDPQASLPHSHI